MSTPAPCVVVSTTLPHRPGIRRCWHVTGSAGPVVQKVDAAPVEALSGLVIEEEDRFLQGAHKR